MKNISYFAFFSLVLTSLQAKEPSSPSNQCSKRVWIDGEYLYWWIKDSPETVPLIITGPLAEDQLLLGEAGTSILMGNDEINNGARSGFKVSAGSWINSNQTIGIEGDYVFLSNRTNTQTVISNGEIGSLRLSIPFFDVVTNSEDSGTLALPENYKAKAVLKVTNSMQDAELNGTFKLLQHCKGYNLNIFTGFLWWNFKEKLNFHTDSPLLTPPNNVFYSNDMFRTHNNFYGGQIGFSGNCLWKNFSFMTRAQVALGGMVGDLKIKGKFVTNQFDDFGSVQIFPAGYFAMPTNSGSFSRTNFSIIPQVRAEIGYSIFKWLNINLGYTFLYATEVFWASNQIDRNINPSQSPVLTITPSDTLEGESRPKPLFKTNSFWSQGINAGLSFKY